MANRPIYMPKSAAPYRTLYTAEFTWNSGLSASQKKKNIIALHESFAAHFPGKKVLEISSKSMQEGGVELSAFNLMKFVPSLGKALPVEVIYQAGKVFKNGGPYPDLLEGTSREAKKDERLRNSGAIVGFRFEGRDFPIRPQTFFYDYLYINALLENPELAKIVLEYDGFTDIEFNPEKSINCQAKSAALFAALSRLGLTDKVRDPDEFLALFEGKAPGIAQTAVPAAVKPASAEAPAPVKEETPAVSVGDTVIYRVWQEGTVVSVDGSKVKVAFASAGEKTLGMSWIADNCEIRKNEG